jgi:glucan phosphoethanolaminetransferase (alkaline phosphatase superfamily)
MKQRSKMRSSTLQLWVIIVFAMLMTAALLAIGWFKGQFNPNFWPSVAAIILAIWGAVSMMMRYIEDRKAKENTTVLPVTGPATPLPALATQAIQKVGECLSPSGGVIG